MDNKNWVVYLIKCSDNSLYCGITNNLGKRLEAHNSGKGAKYTRSRLPLELVGVSPEITKSNALKLEYRIKQAPAHEKRMRLFKRSP
ncbi:MAG: GIY-YIG nuclease family protein [Pseudomonadota bacterium]